MKHAIRSLLRSPGHTGVALLTPAVGINTPTVSGFQALLFRASPCPAPEQLARVAGNAHRGHLTLLPHAEIADLRIQPVVGRTVAADHAADTPAAWDRPRKGQRNGRTGYHTPRHTGAAPAAPSRLTEPFATPADGRDAD